MFPNRKLAKALIEVRISKSWFERQCFVERRNRIMITFDLNQYVAVVVVEGGIVGP